MKKINHSTLINKPKKVSNIKKQSLTYGNSTFKKWRTKRSFSKHDPKVILEFYSCRELRKKLNEEQKDLKVEILKVIHQ